MTFEHPPLPAIQRGLEALYRIDTQLDVRDFLLTESQRAGLYPERLPREQLLLRESDEGVDLALYLCDADLDTINTYDPRHGVDERNLQSLLHVLEGVSHFLYAVDRARSRRTFSALELEIQAEVDKYVTLVLLILSEKGRTASAQTLWSDLIPLLFYHIIYIPDLSTEERARYAAANQLALTYATHLEERFLQRGAMAEFLTEVRRFWRLSFRSKLSHISTCS